MSAVAAPFGLRPIYDQSGLSRARRFSNGIASGYNTNIYQYSPVALVTSTNNTWTLASAGANDFGGSFAGVEYTDANGRRQFSKMWTANLAPLAGTIWYVWVWDDPRTIFEVQANGSLGAATGPGVEGQQISFRSGTIGNGSSTYQLSQADVDTSTLSGSAQQQLRILERGQQIDNDWGDAFTIVRVQIARHQYIANKVAV